MNILEITSVFVFGILESFFVSLSLILLHCLINKNDKTYLNKKTFLMFWLINIFVVCLGKLINMFLPDYKWLKSILTIVAIPMSSFVIYKTKIYKGIITTVLYLVTCAILEVAIILILQSFNLNVYNISNNIYYNGVLGCLIALIECLVIGGTYKFASIYNTSLASVQNKLKYFLPQLIVIIICMFPTMALLMLNDFKYSELLIFTNIIQLFTVAFVSVYNLKFVAKHENTEQELANTIIHNETLSKVNEGVRGFKHDMGNIVQAILGYIAINDSEGAKKYCQNLVIGFNDINILSILSPKVIDDPAIYGVVVNKILVARDKNMTLSLDINTSVSEINFPKFELSRILGILLDNAIEAGLHSKDKKLILTMCHDYKRNADVITVANSINNTNIDVNKIFNKNYSTKENPSGFGLYEVKKFLKHNPQSYIVTTIDEDNHMFTQTLTIDKNVKLLSSEECIKESTVA